MSGRLFIYNLEWRDGIKGHYYPWVVADLPLERKQDFAREWEEDCISSHHTVGAAMDAALVLAEARRETP